ncbi:MAG: helix-turn-helix transcriptional regulator [Candidatus Gastranaerophilaceae bacterium]|jgi:transcriptional regulator with XRE-family HTH domain
MQENEQKYLEIISKNIKRFREEKEYSQEILSEKVNCSREFINRVENRKENVSLKMLLKIAYTLDMPPQDFFIFDNS